ncbi:PAS domain-containing sensor histidine kinase [Bradyrhizobium sp. SYSU BS000235]|uniref:PAS domain-containing sensor histidine kinase n=1 Tax=Bradyrhizobium sp. SYSU BS000235 TaxID=3411332 RepID=UPI003C716B8E
MMKAMPLFERFGFALAGCGIGLVLMRLVDESSGLLAAIAAVFGVAMIAIGAWQGQKRVNRENSKAEQALRIIESMPAMAWFADADGKFLYMSRSPRAFTGLPKEDLVATTDDEFGLRNVVHPDDLDRLHATWRRSLRTGENYVCEHRMWRADGAYHWFRSFGLPARDRDGRVVGWYGTTIDIDELKTAEAALRANERALQQLTDTVPVLIWCLSPQGNPVYFNKRMVEYTGESLEKLSATEADRFEAVVKTIIHPDDAIAVHSAVHRGIATGEPYGLRHRLRRSDGVYHWVDARAEPMRNAEGEIVQWYGVCLDIDAQMLAEESLRQSERQLQQLVDTVPMQIWCVTPTGEPSYISKTMINYTGMALDDFDAEGGLRGAIGDLVHPDDRDALHGALSHSFRTGETFALRFRNRRKDGVYRWQEGRAEPLRNESGDIIQWYGANVDIDDQLATEEALRNRTRELQQLIDAVPVNILSFDPSTRITSASKRYLEQVGSAPAHIQDFEALARYLAHPEDLPVMLPRALNGFATGTPFVNRFRRLDKRGVYTWSEARAQPLRDADGAIVQWYIVGIDIEDEVRALEALRKREQELSQLVDALPIHVWSWTPAGKLAYVNKRSLEELGLSTANFEDTARVAQELVHPEDAPEVLRISHNCLKTGEPFLMRYRRRWKDGNYRWIEGRCEPLRDRDGTIMHWYQVSIDIDDQVRAHEALRQSERSLRQLVETLPAMIDCAAPNGEPIYRSQQLREFLGYELEALDGTGKTRLDGTLDAGVHPDDVAGVKERYAHSLATGEPYARRHRLRRFDGEYRWVETRAEAMRNAEGAIVQWNVMCLDIDGEVRAQEALRLSQERLARASQAASLAELSASIAHEVNQPLAAVVANSHACQRWLAAEPPNIDRAQKTVERIIRDANAAADVVSRIRALFKQSVESRISTLLDGLISEARELMAEEALRRSVRMEFEVESGLSPVAADRVQLQQVLINLMRNGMEAMDALSSDKVLRVRVRRVEETIRAEISDRGRGIEHPDRIFEPFFTTKEHGMGMGLAICRSIIESHGGKLWAEPNEPAGATFIFTLPIGTKDAA